MGSSGESVGLSELSATPSIWLAMRLAAAVTRSLATCAWQAVVSTSVCPRRLPEQGQTFAYQQPADGEAAADTTVPHVVETGARPDGQGRISLPSGLGRTTSACS